MLKKKKKKPHIETEWIARGFCGGKMHENEQRYNFPVIKWVSSGDLMYSMITSANDVVLYT